MGVDSYLKEEVAKSLKRCNEHTNDLARIKKEIENNKLISELYIKTFKLYVTKDDADFIKVEFGDSLEYFNRREDAKLKCNSIQKKTSELYKQLSNTQTYLDLEISNYIALKKKLSWFTGEEYE